MKPDIYQSVTNAIIAAIEDGQTADKFRLPWTGRLVMPTNASTGNLYRGVNVPVLWAQQEARGLSAGAWASYRQWQEIGAQVQKGAKGTRIVFWKAIDAEPENDNEQEERRMFARWSTVFHAQDVEGYTAPEAPDIGTAAQIAEAGAFVRATQADIRQDAHRAFYSPDGDYIALPAPEQFRDTLTSSATECYYATLLHELTHWTGAAHRLDRQPGKRFGDATYAFEELVAELGAAMLCAMLGLNASTRADHAQYIDGWLRGLKQDKRLIFSAASLAQKAADYLFALQPERRPGL